MAKFAYTARDDKGLKVRGSEEAASEDELILRLQSRNLVIVNVILEYGEEKGALLPEAPRAQRRFRRQGIKNEDLVLFSRQIATLLGAGITVLKSLNVTAAQMQSRKFYNVLQELKKNMEGGLSFHEAMSKHPAVFSELWINLVESGEASGNLAIIFGRLANYLERRASFKKKIISSLMYPVLLMFVGLGALLFLTIKIIPTFAELFKGFNLTLPFLTRVLIFISALLRKYIFVLMGIVVTGPFILKRYIATKGGRRRYERFQFSLPVFGEFFRALVVERFSSEMSTLIESGVPLLYSLEITEHSVGNTIMADIVRRIKEEVRQGKPLNNSLDKSRFFDPMVVQMVAVGEEIGELPQMFKRINTFYQEHTETFLVRFSALFEPLMLIFMGLIIGLMVVGMFLPIFQLASIGGAGGR